MKSTNLPHLHEHKLKQSVLDEMPENGTISFVADAMKQLGDPTRLRIFWLLCHAEECVTNIAAIVNMSSPAVSFHLRLLKSAGLIESRRSGREMLYRASDTPLAGALHVMIENIADINCPDKTTQSHDTSLPPDT